VHLAAEVSPPSNVWQAPSTVSSPPLAAEQPYNGVGGRQLSYIAACKLKGAPSGSVYSSGDYSSSSGDYSNYNAGWGSGSYGEPSVHELHQAQARTITQVLGSLTCTPERSYRTQL
jgi:hypothetical protein